MFTKHCYTFNSLHIWDGRKCSVFDLNICEFFSFWIEILSLYLPQLENCVNAWEEFFSHHGGLTYHNQLVSKYDMSIAWASQNHLLLYFFRLIVGLSKQETFWNRMRLKWKICFFFLFLTDELNHQNGIPLQIHYMLYCWAHLFFYFHTNYRRPSGWQSRIQ